MADSVRVGLIQLTAERGLILQIVFQMEDPRVHHPLLSLPVIDARQWVDPHAGVVDSAEAWGRGIGP